MKFVGIDPSLTSAGLVILNDKGEIELQELIKTKSDKSTEERILYIWSVINSHISQVNDYIIHIEGLSFGAKGQAIMELAALHYYIRIMMSQDPLCKYKVIAPTELKKFVTGKGNSPKELMLMKTFKRWGIEFESDDLCDAFGLAQMAFTDYKVELVKNL